MDLLEHYVMLYILGEREPLWLIFPISILKLNVFAVPYDRVNPDTNRHNQQIYNPSQKSLEHLRK